jgi:hypothetical protein
MDRVAEDPEESSIRGRELLQSRVRVAELLLREGAGRRVPMCTLHVAIGGSVVAHRRCTGRYRSSVAQHDRSSNGPSNHPSRISRGTTRGIRVGVGDGWGCRRENGSRDECPGASIDVGAAGAAIRADGRAGVGCRGRCRFHGSRNRAWRQRAGGAQGNSPGDPTRPRGIKGTHGNSLNPPTCLHGIHWQCDCSRRG